jgi:hypothetical protein
LSIADFNRTLSQCSNTYIPHRVLLSEQSGLYIRTLHRVGEMSLVNFIPEDKNPIVEVDVCCSSDLSVSKLVSEIGDKLKISYSKSTGGKYESSKTKSVGCYLSYLEVVYHSGYRSEDAISSKEMSENMYVDATFLHRIDTALEHYRPVVVTPTGADMLGEGKSVAFPDCVDSRSYTVAGYDPDFNKKGFASDEVVRVYKRSSNGRLFTSGEFLGLGAVERLGSGLELLKPVVMQGYDSKETKRRD